MNFSPLQCALALVTAMGVLFLAACLTERKLLPDVLTRHPATYVLSLGVFAGAIASNAIFQLARQHGFDFMLYYLGVVLMFLVAPVLLLPLMRLCRIYQLSSLADVLAFRFHSQNVGAVVSLAMCLTLLPLLALQIQAVADSLHILSSSRSDPATLSSSQGGLALLFCLIVTGFTILFGTRNITPQERNTGLIAAIALTSLVKLLALLVLMVAAVHQVFGGFDAMQQWLNQSGALTAAARQHESGSAARLLLLLFFAGAVCMPHLFHMTFAESRKSQHLGAASWGLPLYLVLLSIPVLPITWAGIALGRELPQAYTGLALGAALDNRMITTAAFITSLAAASATLIVTTLALQNMVLNHLILPHRGIRLAREENLHARLRRLRRSLIALLVLAGYLCFLAVGERQSLMALGLVAFSGTLQFLPGVIATPYWRRANRHGLVAGLGAGLAVWCLTLLAPALGAVQPTWLGLFAETWFGDGEQAWAVACLIALAANCALFALVSRLTSASEEEQLAAEICALDAINTPSRRRLAVHSADDFIAALATTLGDGTARSEVERALRELRFDSGESRPYALRRLRRRIEANLSCLLGPSVAHSVMHRCIPFQSERHGSSHDLYHLERQLDRAEGHFTGLAAELDQLRRHYRETVDNMPVGVFSVAPDGEILLWNRSMEAITGIAGAEVVGSLQGSIPDPWCLIFGEFLADQNESLLRREVPLTTGSSRWVSLHKTPAGDGSRGEQLVLVEDISELERLEAELLHNERLASLGRLAAGVAHEIGNPITGIACLAQNLEYESDPETVRETARDILKQTQRVSRIVESLINFSHVGSRLHATRLAACNLADCIDEAIHLLELDPTARQVAFCNECDRELLVVADAHKLLQVFVNVLGNARDACDTAGIVRIRAETRAGEAIIGVEDNGCGIPPAVQGQVFEPFYTTKEPGEGTGLGLSLVYSIMEEMHGSVQLHSPLHQGRQPGTRVTLQLPLGSYGPEFSLEM